VLHITCYCISGAYRATPFVCFPLPHRCPYTVSGEHEPSVILKDNDIKYKIRLPRLTTENLLTQIRADADFLLSIGVMDYSLLGTGAVLYCAGCV
jgi:hypothetical protein